MNLYYQLPTYYSCRSLIKDNVVYFLYCNIYIILIVYDMFPSHTRCNRERERELNKSSLRKKDEEEVHNAAGLLMEMFKSGNGWSGITC